MDVKSFLISLIIIVIVFLALSVAYGQDTQEATKRANKGYAHLRFGKRTKM